MRTNTSENPGFIHDYISKSDLENNKLPWPDSRMWSWDDHWMKDDRGMKDDHWMSLDDNRMKGRRDDNWMKDDHWMTIGWPSYQSPVQRPGQWHIGNFLYCLNFFHKLRIIKKVTRKRFLSNGCTNVRDLVLQAIISIVLFLCSFAIFGEAHVF